MLKKSKSLESNQRLPIALPMFLGVLDQSHQILMPFAKSSIRIWDTRHQPLMEALLSIDPKDRYCVVVHRDLSPEEHAHIGILVYVESIRRCEPEGYDLNLDCLQRVIVSTRNIDGHYEECSVEPMDATHSLRDNISARLDQLVQAAFQLAQDAHGANVQLGCLLEDLPHRRALLYRMAALLIQ